MLIYAPASLHPFIHLFNHPSILPPVLLPRNIEYQPVGELGCLEGKLLKDKGDVGVTCCRSLLGLL